MVNRKLYREVLEAIALLPHPTEDDMLALALDMGFDPANGRLT